MNRKFKPISHYRLKPIYFLQIGPGERFVEGENSICERIAGDVGVGECSFLWFFRQCFGGWATRIHCCWWLEFFPVSFHRRSGLWVAKTHLHFFYEWRLLIFLFSQFCYGECSSNCNFNSIAFLVLEVEIPHFGSTIFLRIFYLFVSVFVHDLSHSLNLVREKFDYHNFLKSLKF